MIVITGVAGGQGAAEVAAPRDAGATVIVMVFLMSDECPCMSGAEIAVDGGFSSCTSAEALSDALSD